ncbi:MAG: M23 family metallopeptidase, partial [Anaerolineales bacterium]
LLLPRIGDSKLELAVRTGASPWSLTTLSQTEIKMWVVPGTPLVVPGGEHWVGALPHPIVSVEVDPLPAVQGKMTVVSLELNQPGWVEGRLEDQTLNFFPLDSHQWIALQGIHAMAEPGLYDLEVRIYTSEGGELTFAFSQPVRIREGGYGFETINSVPAETIDPDVVGPEEELVALLLSPATPERHWEGAFQFPSDYYTDSFISVFGTRRSYNYGAYYYYHTGLDFYGSGVPILAPAPGQVVFTGSLVVRGNATYIDHGWGVYSGYFHQSEIYMSEGDFVETGQVIGKVGGTGRSTGPHLHWEIWVGGVPVDPLDWVEKVFP